MRYVLQQALNEYWHTLETRYSLKEIKKARDGLLDKHPKMEIRIAEEIRTYRVVRKQAP